MRLTTKGRYAVTALLDIAIHGKEKPISLADISQRQGISLSYLEQLFAKLKKNALVASSRGPGGGYQLSRESKDIFVAQIIDAVNENIDTTRCGGKGDCQDGEICLTHHLWQDLSEQMHEFLNKISLGELIARREIKAVADRQDRLQQRQNGAMAQRGESSSNNMENHSEPEDHEEETENSRIEISPLH